MLCNLAPPIELLASSLFNTEYAWGAPRDTFQKETHLSVLASWKIKESVERWLCPVYFVSFQPVNTSWEGTRQWTSLSYFGIRPYCVECTTSCPISEVKLRQASLVLGWETTRKSGVMYPFYSLSLLSPSWIPLVLYSFHSQIAQIVDMGLEWPSVKPSKKRGFKGMAFLFVSHFCSLNDVHLSLCVPC